MTNNICQYERLTGQASWVFFRDEETQATVPFNTKIRNLELIAAKNQAFRFRVVLNDDRSDFKVTHVWDDKRNSYLSHDELVAFCLENNLKWPRVTYYGPANECPFVPVEDVLE